MDVLKQGQLKRIILLPFFLILIISFGSMWFLYLTNSRQVALNLVDRLANEKALSISEQISGFLTSARVLLFANEAILDNSFESLEADPFFLPQLFERQLKKFPSIEIMALGTSTGNYWEAQRVSPGVIRYGIAGENTLGNLDFFLPNNLQEPLIENRVENYNPRERPWYINAVTHGGFSWSEPYTLATNPHELVVAATLPFSLPGNTTGVLSVVVNLKSIEQFVINTLDPTSGRIIIVDPQGTTLVDTSMREREWEDQSSRLFSGDILRTSQRILLPNLYDPLWHVVVNLNLEFVTLELSQADTLAVIIMGIMFLVFFIIGFQVVLSITRPIQKLSQTIIHLDLSTQEEPGELKVLTQRNDEIGRLAQSFHSMYQAQRTSFHKIEESLRDKDILLREVHHRVKNNLQIVSSMLNIQAMEVTDPKAKEMFDACNSRIIAMALVHENAYGSGMISQICMDEYLNQICNSLQHTSFSQANLKVTLSAEAKHAKLPLEQAIPCGLIVNELVTNSIKHGFPDRTMGKIDVRLIKLKNTWNLTVTDDGEGFPSSSQNSNVSRTKPGIGTELIEGLTSQLKGTITRRNLHTPHTDQSGAQVTLEFPDISE